MTESSSSAWDRHSRAWSSRAEHNKNRHPNTIGAIGGARMLGAKGPPWWTPGCEATLSSASWPCIAKLGTLHARRCQGMHCCRPHAWHPVVLSWISLKSNRSYQSCVISRKGAARRQSPVTAGWTRHRPYSSCRPLFQNQANTGRRSLHGTSALDRHLALRGDSMNNKQLDISWQCQKSWFGRRTILLSYATLASLNEICHPPAFAGSFGAESKLMFRLVKVYQCRPMSDNSDNSKQKWAAMNELKLRAAWSMEY